MFIMIGIIVAAALLAAAVIVTVIVRRKKQRATNFASSASSRKNAPNGTEFANPLYEDGFLQQQQQQQRLRQLSSRTYTVVTLSGVSIDHSDTDTDTGTVGGVANDLYAAVGGGGVAGSKPGYDELPASHTEGKFFENMDDSDKTTNLNNPFTDNDEKNGYLSVQVGSNNAHEEQV